MKYLVAILGLIFFYIPLIFKLEGLIVIPLLGIANTLYLFSRVKNPLHFWIIIIPLLLFYLYSRFWIGMGRSASDPLGMGGVAAGLMIYIFLIGVVGFLEFFTLKQIVTDFSKLVPVLTHWQMNDLKNWLFLTILIPIGAHLITGYLIVDSSRPKPTTVESRMISMNNRPIVFQNNADLKYFDGRFRSFVKHGSLVEATRLKVGEKWILFAPEYPMSFYKNQKVQSGILVEDTEFVVNGIQIRFSGDYSIEFYPNGAVKEGVLAEDTVFELAKQARKIFLPTEAKVTFYQKGALKSFYPPSGISLQTGAGVSIPAKMSDYQKVNLYPDGSLKSGYLAQNIALTINNQNVTLKDDEQVDFYPNGGLKRGTLAKDVVIRFIGRETQFYAGTEVFFSDTGNLAGVHFLSLGYYYHPDGTRIATRGSGSYLYKNTEIFAGQDNPVYIHYVETDRNSQFPEYVSDHRVEIDAVGYLYDNWECTEVLEKNNISIDFDDETPNILVMFRHSNPKKQKIREILFVEPVKIRCRDKDIKCPVFQWIRLH